MCLERLGKCLIRLHSCHPLGMFSTLQKQMWLASLVERILDLEEEDQCESPSLATD